MNRKIVFFSVAGVLLLVFAVAAVLYKNHKVGEQTVAVSGNQKALLRAGAPVKGNKDAKVTIVEFFDPACETCRDFYPLMAQLLEQFPGKVKVIMRYAPLHPGSDQVVKMLEAAQYQDKFWQALELLFADQPRWVINHVSQPMRAQVILDPLNLNRDQFFADMNRPEVAQVIQQDIKDGQILGVRATPEFFVNGRPLPSFGFDQLRSMVEAAVADAY